MNEIGVIRVGFAPYFPFSPERKEGSRTLLVAYFASHPLLVPREEGRGGATAKKEVRRVESIWIGVVMILPQVHLRKPCYDFTFL